MPKKFAGDDTRGLKAKAQKAAARADKEAAAQKSQQKAEDVEWAAGANSRAKAKAQTAAEKAAEKEARKLEKQAILAAEDVELAAMKGVKAKGTKSKGSKLAAKRAAAAELAALQAQLGVAASGGGADVQWSTGIDSALDAAAGAIHAKKASAEAERHPERRQKAAYAAWEEVQMPLLKEDYPGLRRSQLKEKLHNLWKKAPENPMNDVHVVEYNAKVDDSAPSEGMP